MKRLKILLISILGVLLGSIVALLVNEYLFFNREAQVMLALQAQYRSHMESMRSVVEDYAKTKERLVLLEELTGGEKKNLEGLSPSFPEGVRVYSSDDSEPDVQDSFTVVNRELEYLKEATIAHMHEQEAASLLARIDLNEWRDYTDRLLEQNNSQAKKASLPARAKARSSRQPKSSPGERHQTVAQTGKRDMVFSWPIDRSRFWLSSFFGPRKKRNGGRGFHYGIDMAALKGTSVMAAASGVVIEARHASGWGNTIVIAHNGKYKTRYAHLKSIFVSVGQEVRRGAYIGSVGDTGFVRSAFGRDPSHLHFELYVFGKQVNPMHFLV